MGWPSDKEIEEVLKNLDDDSKFSVVLPYDASPTDRIKFEICQQFVIYLNDTNSTQTDLAKKLGVDKSRVNWIVKYRVEHFTIDRLYELLNILHPEKVLRIS